MIQRIRIVNFRQIEDETIELAPAVVVVGPNNGGKTTFLQAISLFAIAVKKWREQRVNKKTSASSHTGVAINASDIVNIPLTEFREIWRNSKLRRGAKNSAEKPITENILIEIAGTAPCV